MPSDAPDAAGWESALPYLDAWLGYRVDALRLPGLQAAVYFDGDVRFSTAYGYADTTTGTALTTDHRFRIASHSKTFTGTAIMQLVAAGAIVLDDPVARFVPELARTAVGARTVRELLQQSAGITRDGVDGDYWQLERPFPDADELVRILRDEGEVYESNVRFKYSNIGYSLLGMVVAAASGTSYNEYVTRHIVEVLGLTNTAPEWTPHDGHRYATGHTGRHAGEPRAAIPHADSRAMSSATGFCSTAHDLVRYFSAHFDGDDRLISDAAKRIQQHEAWGCDISDTATSWYGFGMSIKSIGGHRVVGHSGGYPGFKTQSLFDPRTRLSLSVLVNAIDGPAAELGAGMLALLDRAAAPAPGPRRSDLARYTGRFGNMWGVLDIAALGGRLYAIDPRAADPVADLIGLEPLTATEFRIESDSGFPSVGERLTYLFDDDGRVSSIHGITGMTRWPVAPGAAGRGTDPRSWPR